MAEMPGLQVKPAFERDLGNGLHLRLLQAQDAEELFALVDRNREHLRPWMPWVDGTSGVADILTFIENTLREFAEAKAIRLGVCLNGSVVGHVGADVRTIHRAAEVGYWLDAAHQGRGIMTRAVEALLTHLFDEKGIHRTEIRAAPENRRSRAMAERFGFRMEGVLRQYTFCSGRWLDQVVYGLLEDEWEARTP
ncbi:MAG: GNAT family protein [Actinomycetota bacterium]